VSSSVTPTPAATVILIRPAGDTVEVFLLRRHKRATFMSNAFVFPGGKVEPADRGFEEAALRELFEEAGVLLVREELSTEKRESWRKRLLANEASFADLLAAEGLTPAGERLHWWSRWVTPSVEPKRFDAHFFLAELPPGQVPSFDQQETVDELWITPADALARAGTAELRLPPPQLRTLYDLAPHPTMEALIAAAAERAAHPHPILPRFAQVGETMTLLLPWDAEYETLGTGDAAPTPAGHFLARGPTRFILEGMGWRMA
jgi:8-oxo-dGTP pyrophosphatase MutT (NUDIX family)